MNAVFDVQESTSTVADYLSKMARTTARISPDDRQAALRFAVALRDPVRVARLLEGVDVATLGKPKRLPVSAGHAA